jgi:hypothetical protein
VEESNPLPGGPPSGAVHSSGERLRVGDPHGNKVRGRCVGAPVSTVIAPGWDRGGD